MDDFMKQFRRKRNAVSNRNHALFDAIKHNDQTKVELLLRDKVDPNITLTSNSITPLLLATVKGSSDIVAMLLEYKADVNHEYIDGATPLMHACVNGHVQVAKILLKNNADIHHRSKTKATALMVTGSVDKINNRDIAKLLIKHGALTDIDAQDEHDNTALMVASCNNSGVVEILLQHGANITLRNDDGYTALTLAASNACPIITKQLLTAGANINALDKDGNTPLILTCESHRDIIQQFEQQDSDIQKESIFINSKTKVMHDLQEVVKLLLEHNADITISNNQGQTALDISQECPDQTLYKILTKQD